MIVLLCFEGCCCQTFFVYTTIFCPAVVEGVVCLFVGLNYS